MELINDLTGQFGEIASAILADGVKDGAQQAEANHFRLHPVKPLRRSCGFQTAPLPTAALVMQYPQQERWNSNTESEEGDSSQNVHFESDSCAR